MAKINAYECDVCLKIAKSTVCNCCQGDQLPMGWIAAPLALPQGVEADPNAEATILTACANQLCQDMMLQHVNAVEEAAPEAPTEPGTVM